LESRKLAVSFEGLNSSIAQLTGELLGCKVAHMGFTAKSIWWWRCWTVL